eukprot:TRINITY_DN8881_c0_g1_i1.p1 TRINITY_DN8881_c0_g1~~TRINITY_DN8881_c0_g1_i1.p1  ORF type:complete len:350 (-),score=156.31 TRINITY_DN8881_c0_g1_i1:126-1142(-)
MSMASHMDITVDITTEEVMKAGAVEVIKTVRPTWEQELVEWKVFSDGITNKLLGAWCMDKVDMVLVRVYGAGTEKIIDRKVELENMKRMEDMGCGSKVYGAFNNGICYEFIHGEILTQGMLMDKVIYRSVARMMAKMHSVQLEKKKVLLWDRMEHFISCCNPDSDRLVKEGMTKDRLRGELNMLRGLLENCSSPVVFCHNDALLANIVVKKKTEEVIFIDMEYGGPSYAAFDIANHFVEFVGCEGELDYERWLPSKEYQVDWIEEYLAHRGDIMQEEVEVVYNMVQQFMLCAHLLWAVWAVIQAENSDIDFDFVDYALQRFREYNRWKEVLGMVGEEE